MDLVDGDAAFLVLVGLVLCAQLTYIVALRPYRRSSVLRTRPWVVGLYIFAVFAMVAVCASAAGILVVPVAIYASCVGEWFETAGFEVARRRDVAGSRWQDDLHRPDLVEVGDAVRGLPCAVDAVLVHAARGAQAQCRSM
ncbi:MULTISPECIES: lysoplasmalogenase [Rhodococcus]|uniref:lysoplasmalogenase n=1 Tax=Rhodococcus TaxID=1827 RepID=UPI001E3DD56A|nr:lysoplasmalogenase [Rhodococcus pyridinivorans]MCD2119341.1 lysoplasmalogenase [Rhodococcus pyridinivorans]MCZ4628252.1 lysoplasmalogenase [Rhodococcus pyridinivorans]MCZ4649513.1 lysoplasmalogenase [Rhodococcus pyridinivorans]MDJ0483124.1 lysoplasmalogenase [Rhodococcus pyridinivorans]MDV7255567.1 lysoplasmalogenase [Rhodococcus pyridinivorans]